MATSDSQGVYDSNATTTAAALVATAGTDGRAGDGRGYGYGYPTFEDAPFINQPILILDGGSESYPIQNKWIRVELIMEQSSTVARKACRDKRPMGPPTFILMNLYQVHHPLAYYPDGRPIQPPPDCSESQIPATDDLATYFICIPWLFRVYPPTREEELGRVLRTKTVSGHERIRAQKGDPRDLPKPKTGDAARSLSSATAEQDSGDDDGDSDGPLEEDDDPQVVPHGISQDHPSNPTPRPPAAYPYPATAISCHDPRWPSAVETARDRARQHWLSLPHQQCPINHGPLEVGVDLSKEEMAWVQDYLPREDLRFVRTEHGFQDMRSRLQEVSTRKGCLLLNSFSTGSKSYVFVFDNMLLLEEGYWAIRFAVCNIGWSAHPTYSSGERSYGTLADVYTGAIGVYSSKQWPTLPPTSKVTEHYAAQIKLCHREQAGGKKSLKISSPTADDAVKPVIKGKGEVATTKKPHRRQTTSPHASTDPDSSSQTRRKVTEIRRDARESKVHNSTPLAPLGDSERSGRGHDGEIEVARTEPCSPALSAQVMAAAGHRESTWVWEGWSPSHEGGGPQMLGRPYSDMSWGPPSFPLELPYPLVSSIWPNPPSQRYPEVIPTRVRAIEGLLSHSARPQSPVPRPPRPRPQSLQMVYSPSPRSPLSVTHSAPSTGSPPPSAISACFTPPRPSIPARSMSWALYSTVPFTEQVAPVYASSPGPPLQLLQAPGQQGYFMHYPDANQYRYQTRTAYTEETVSHQSTFEPGRLHISQHPHDLQSVNLYPSPTSSASFAPASVTPPTNATQHSCSSPATHEPSR